MFSSQDFSAFIAIEDAMEEEEKNPSPKYSSNGSKSEMTTGCLFSCGCITFGIFLGIIFENLALFIGVLVIGAIIGIAYDVNKKMIK